MEPRMADEKKKGPNPRELALTAAGLTAIALVYVNTWHANREIDIKRETKAIEDARKKLQADEDVISTLIKEQNAPQEEKQDARLATIREANNNFANIVKTLSGTDDPDLFSIRNLTVDKEEQFSEYSKVLFTLEVDAPFLHVGQFLEKLEQSNLLTELVNVEATRIDPELKRCSVKLSIYSYVSRL
jgi:hypothetical protein